VEVDDTRPNPGDEITISGHIDGADEEDVIEITITDPDGVSRDFETEVDDDEEFNESYEVPDPAEDGIYTVEVEHPSEDSIFAYFLIDEEDDDVEVVTDSDTYSAGDEVEIVGEVHDTTLGEDEVEISVLGPDGSDIGPGDIELDDGEFAEEFDLDDDTFPGIYAVIVEYDGEESGWSIFAVEDDVDSGEFAIQLDSIAYRAGDEVSITGSIDEDDVELGEEVYISVIDPDGNTIIDDSTEPTFDGSFEFAFDLDDDAVSGTYLLIASYVVYDDKHIAFTVTSSSGGGAHPDLTGRLSKTLLQAGETLAIFGSVDNVINGEVVNIVILDSGSGFIGVSSFPQPELDGSYSANLRLPTTLPEGEDYVVVLAYGGDEIRLSFDVQGVFIPGPPITVMTNGTQFEAGATVAITGDISEDALVHGRLMVLQVYNPENEPYRFDPVTPESDGSFSYPLVVGGPLGVAGEWYIKVTYGESVAETSFLLV
jgi:hypothetical protein